MNKMFYHKGLGLIACTSFLVVFLYIFNTLPVNALAQQMTSEMKTMDTQKNIAEIQKSNWTGTVDISKVIRESFNPLIKVSLSEAINKAELNIGNNTSAVAAFIHPVNGYLVYVIYLLNDYNEVTKVIIDVGTGNTLNVKKMTIEDMMFKFHHGGMTMSHSQSFEKNSMMEKMMSDTPY
ncbi:MAG TPA: PepSY domain-containing protein [Nitrososphaeraceae archaeon]|nr:PepSY domain-containing protein [Nitrososphaeraceae archaeon]